MSVRSTIFVLAIAAAAVPAAFAQGTSTFVGGEAGWIVTPAPSSVTAAQVRADFMKFRANPVDAAGGRYVGGELGYVAPMHAYALRNGTWVCTDKIAHNPAPVAVMSPLERRLFEEGYPA